MIELMLGLVLFSGPHSVRIVADEWRSHTRERIGASRYKLVYGLVSWGGFVLMIKLNFLDFSLIFLETPCAL